MESSAASQALVTIRRATAADIDTLVEHRRTMFAEIGYSDDAKLDQMAVAFRPWALARLDSGEYLAWLAIAADGTVAAGLGLWLMDWPPHMIGPGSPRGNILNVYTRPAYRRKGLARQLLEVALDWCRENRIRAVILHSSENGRSLYEAQGFRPTNEMRLLID